MGVIDGRDSQEYAGGDAHADAGRTTARDAAASAAARAANRSLIERTQRSGNVGVARRHNLVSVFVPVLAACCALAAAPSPSATEAHRFAVSLARQGPRPAGSAAERKAHQRVAARFRAAGLRVGYERFTVPGKGPSRDVIGIRDALSDCLVIAMAHADTVPPAPGADDNASGVGTLVALARAVATGPEPACDIWLVATGAEERPYTGQPDHLGASALAARLKRTKRLE